MPAPDSRHNRRNARFVIPAIGASTTGGSTARPPIGGKVTDMGPIVPQAPAPRGQLKRSCFGADLVLPPEPKHEATTEARAPRRRQYTGRRSASHVRRPARGMRSWAIESRSRTVTA